MPNRFPITRRRRSPNLQQQIIKDRANITTGTAPGLINQFTEIAKEVGSVILKLLILDFYGETTAADSLNLVRCVLLSKPISEGVPVSTDLDDPRYVIASYAVGVAGAGNIEGYHWRQNLRILVPAGNNVYVCCQSDAGVTIACAFDLRLFWQST